MIAAEFQFGLNCFERNAWLKTKPSGDSHVSGAEHQKDWSMFLRPEIAAVWMFSYVRCWWSNSVRLYLGCWQGAPNTGVMTVTK